VGLRTVDIAVRGKSTVLIRVGAVLSAVIPGSSNWRSPTLVFFEPDGADQETRYYAVLLSSLRPPENSQYVGSVRTGEYEVSHVYEVKE
jgi:hypothetical protein